MFLDRMDKIPGKTVAETRLEILFSSTYAL